MLVCHISSKVSAATETNQTDSRRKLMVSKEGVEDSLSMRARVWGLQSWISFKAGIRAFIFKLCEYSLCL